MSKIFNLTKNELIKQFKKKSVVALSAVVLTGAFLSPIASKYMNKGTDYSEYNNQVMQSVENNIKQFDKNTSQDKVIRSYMNAEKESLILLRDYNVNGLDWMDELGREYAENLIYLDVVNFVRDGMDQGIISENIMNVDPSELEIIFNSNKDKLSDLEKKYKNKANEFKKAIEEKDYGVYAKSKIEFYDTVIKASKENLKEQPNDEYTKNSIEKFESLSKLLQYRVDNKIVDDGVNWKGELLDKVSEDIEIVYSMPLSEEDHIINTSYSDGYRMPYGEYKKQFEEKKIAAENNIKVNLYSVENDIQPLGYSNDARTIVDKLYNIFIIAAMVIVILISGGIVSNEFSKGTIRLLLVRPVSRSKVLASKLMATFIIGLGVVFASTVLITISSGIVYGFNTLTIPVLSLDGSNIVSSNYFIYLLPNLLISCSSLVFIGSLGFMLSTITKSSVVSVVLPTVLLFIADPLSNILISKGQLWVGKSFLPYMNIPMLDITSSMINGGSIEVGMYLNQNLGAIWMFGLALVFIVVAFLNFIKSDIRN